MMNKMICLCHSRKYLPWKEADTYLQPVFNPNLLLRESPRLTPQHFRPLLQRHPHLRLPYRYKTFRQIHVIFLHELDGHHDIVYIFEDERSLRGVFALCPHESGGVVAPVASGVEVVRCVIAIVETEAI